MNRQNYALSLLMATMLVLSCSGGGSAIQPETHANIDLDSQGHEIAPQLWGYWGVAWNEDAGNFDVVPLRSAMFACNVINFINQSDSNLVINVNSIQPSTSSTEFDIDVGFMHPFPGLDAYTGFDVMGIFMGHGSESYPGTGGYLIGGTNVQQLLNPDGFTRRFNAPEFAAAGQILPLQGYIPGGKGSPGYTPTAILNPFKYYADGLDPGGDVFKFLESNSENRGCYRPGNQNFRNFKVRFPNSLMLFQYAVLANWEPNILRPLPPTSLDDFPVTANSQEAVAVNVFDLSDAYWVNETTYGGDVVLDITPWDWSASASGVMEEYEIKLFSPAWTGSFDVDMTPTVVAEHRCTFQASIPGSSLLGNGNQPIWIEITYPDFDYKSPVGIPNFAMGKLTSYFKSQVYIIDFDPMLCTDRFIYGFADSNFFDHVYGPFGSNVRLISNLLNLQLGGAYSENKIFLYYRGHTDVTEDVVPDDLGPFIGTLGYEFVYVPPEPYVPLDTTGVKMLVLAVYFTKEGEYYTPQEVQQVKKLLNGGGVCVICAENSGIYLGGTGTMDKLLQDLKVDFSYPCDLWVTSNPYADITPDPITEGVSGIEGISCGRFEVLGEATSLIRGNEAGYIYDAVVKSPWKG